MLVEFLFESNDLMWKETSWKPLATIGYPMINVNERTKQEFNVSEFTNSNTKIPIYETISELGPFCTNEMDTP